ncbi:unnamed protein product [Lota lota]
MSAAVLQTRRPLIWLGGPWRAALAPTVAPSPPAWLRGLSGLLYWEAEASSSALLLLQETAQRRPALCLIHFGSLRGQIAMQAMLRRPCSTSTHQSLGILCALSSTGEVDHGQTAHRCFIKSTVIKMERPSDAL